MKVVLLVLGGDATRARERIGRLYPQSEIDDLPRAVIEQAGSVQSLGALRQRRADVFAVATERLAWQQGQNALLLFGALGGAHRVILLDAHGARREETRAHILAAAPARLAREILLSASTVARAWRELKRLEQLVASNQPSPERATRRRTGKDASDDELKIAFIRATPGAGTQVGGATSHINGFLDAARRHGAHIKVISNDRIAGLDELKTSLTLIEPEPSGITRAIFDLRNGMLFSDRAAREIERQAPDLIYQRYSRFSWAGVAASLGTGRTLFLEYNGSEVWMGKHWDGTGMPALLARCEKLNLAAAARVFVVSEVERRNLERVGVDPRKIVVNPNGVDVEKFRPNVGGTRVRQELGVRADETLVGFVGTFGPWHGVVTLAEAITLMPADARVRFLLIGGGTLRAEVERILKETATERRAILRGAVEHERVPALLDACDVLASPHVGMADGSEFFGSPTKLFEYMAMGKGIVASRLGQIAEVLRDDETALLVKPGDARQLSEAILRLANSPTLRERLGAAARREAHARYTWMHNAARILDAYRDAQKRSKRGELAEVKTR